MRLTRVAGKSQPSARAVGRATVHGGTHAASPCAGPGDPACNPGSAGAMQLGGTWWRSRCLRKPRRERGAGQHQSRDERTVKDLRKQIEQARPTQLNRSGLAKSLGLSTKRFHRRERPTKISRVGSLDGMNPGSSVPAVQPVQRNQHGTIQPRIPLPDTVSKRRVS